MTPPSMVPKDLNCSQQRARLDIHFPSLPIATGKKIGDTAAFHAKSKALSAAARGSSLVYNL